MFTPPTFAMPSSNVNIHSKKIIKPNLKHTKKVPTGSKTQKWTAQDDSNDSTSSSEENTRCWKCKKKAKTHGTSDESNTSAKRQVRKGKQKAKVVEIIDNDEEVNEVDVEDDDDGAVEADEDAGDEVSHQRQSYEHRSLTCHTGTKWAAERWNSCSSLHKERYHMWFLDNLHNQGQGELQEEKWGSWAGGRSMVHGMQVSYEDNV